MAVSPAAGHATNSALREIILEHAFVADLLRHLWQIAITDVEVLRSEFDAGGYDLVVSQGSIIRHVQLKGKRLEGRTSHFVISDRLTLREAGCVLAFVVKDDLTLDHYLWFGGDPREPLPVDGDFRRARHTRGDATGYKAQRRERFQLPLSRFTKLYSIGEVAQALLGPLKESDAAAPYPAGKR